MSKNGLSILQCADGHRSAMIMNNLGVTEDDVMKYLSPSSGNDT